MKILIVEDEKILRDSLAEGLHLKGYAIDVAADGESADEKLFCENYDLIVLDLNLPKLDGFTVLENFRKKNADVPVLILLSACFCAFSASCRDSCKSSCKERISSSTCNNCSCKSSLIS